MGTGAREGPCDFCDLEAFRSAEVFLENRWCLYASHGAASAELPWAGIVLPKAHRVTAFDLTDDEWLATAELLRLAKVQLQRRCARDGYNVGWNCYPAAGQQVPHAHLHVIPRFADEPEAGRGMRWWLRQPGNRRPSPSRPGQGLADGS